MPSLYTPVPVLFKKIRWIVGSLFEDSTCSQHSILEEDAKNAESYVIFHNQKSHMTPRYFSVFLFFPIFSLSTMKLWRYDSIYYLFLIFLNCLSLGLSIYISLSLFFSLRVSVSLYLSVFFLSIHIYLSIFFLSVCLFLCLCVFLSIYVSPLFFSLCVSLSLTVCLSVDIYMSLFIFFLAVCLYLCFFLSISLSLFMSVCLFQKTGSRLRCMYDMIPSCSFFSRLPVVPLLHKNKEDEPCF